MQIFAGNRRKPQIFAGNRRNPFVPFSLSLLIPPYFHSESVFLMTLRSRDTKSIAVGALSGSPKHSVESFQHFWPTVRRRCPMAMRATSDVKLLQRLLPQTSLWIALSSFAFSIRIILLCLFIVPLPLLFFCSSALLLFSSSSSLVCFLPLLLSPLLPMPLGQKTLHTS